MKKNYGGGFASLYLFSYEAKNTAALYFLASVIVYLGLGKITNSSDSLNVWTALQMVIACSLIGFSQKLIVPLEKLDIKRSIIWIVLSSTIVISFALGFNWFGAFPLWCTILYCVVLVIGFAMLTIGLLFDSKRETQKLDAALKAYQKKLG